MYTRIFMRFDHDEDKEVVHISPYNFSCYVNDELIGSGLIEDMDSEIQSLLEEGFEELYA